MAGEESSELSEEEYVREIIAAARGPIKTNTVGRVLSYDAETQTARVQPLIPIYVVDWEGESEGYRALRPVRLPVAFPGSGEVCLHFHLEEGTDGIITIVDRDTTGWEQTAARTAEPPTRSRFDHRYALFIPEVRAPASPRDAEFWDSDNKDPTFHLGTNQAVRVAQATADKALALAEKVAGRFNDLKDKFDGHTHAIPPLVDGTGAPVTAPPTDPPPDPLPVSPGDVAAPALGDRFPSTSPSDLETERVKVDK